jgi:hypothetical protein
MGDQRLSGAPMCGANLTVHVAEVAETLVNVVDYCQSLP